MNLRPGMKVILWPRDTYTKHAVVREADCWSVTFEITEVEEKEPYYRPGYIIKLPRSRVKIFFKEEKNE